MRQSDIIKLLRREFGHHEVTVFSASAKNRAGVLDCEIAYRGQSFWVEIKVNADTLRPLQEKFMARHFESSFYIHYKDIDKSYLLLKHDTIFSVIICLIESKDIKKVFKVLKIKI